MDDHGPNVGAVGAHQAVDGRHRDGAGDGADAEHRVEDAEGELVEPELEPAGHRQERADGDPRHEEAEAAGEHRLQLARAADEGDAGPRRLEEALAALGRAGLGRALPAAQRQDDADIGAGVDGEQQEDADQAEQDLAQHRPHGAGKVEARAVERDGRPEVGAAHDLGHHGVPGRGVHGVAEAHAEGERQQAPGVEPAEQGQHRQGRRHAHHPELAGDDVASPLEAVGQDAGEEAEQEHRQGAGGRQKGHEDRLGRQAGHLPGSPGALHPAADVGQQVGDPQATEGRVGKRSESRGMANGAGRRRDGLSRHPERSRA